MIMTVFSMTALASERIDTDRGGSLTILAKDGKTPLAGVRFDLYLIAAEDEDGALTPASEFAGYHVNVQDDEARQTLASTLEGYVLRDAPAPYDSGTTDAEGLAAFPTAEKRIKPGLYLVLGHRHTQNERRYDPVPFVVMVPGTDGETGEKVYDMTVDVKCDSVELSRILEGSVIDRKVIKVWNDEGHEAARPKKIVVCLLRDGRVYDTVTLSDENNWRYLWRKLDAHCAWTLAEEEIEDYTVEIVREGNAFVVTNTYSGNHSGNPAPAASDKPVVSGEPAASDEPVASGEPAASVNSYAPDEYDAQGTSPGAKLPQTGQLWRPVPVLAAAGLLALIIGLICRREGGTDEK